MCEWDREGTYILMEANSHCRAGKEGQEGGQQSGRSWVEGRRGQRTKDFLLNSAQTKAWKNTAGKWDTELTLSLSPLALKSPSADT